MRRNQKGFTLMELMVVIVIVAILAAVAVPLYINYVKDARRTEAKAAIGALATAMEEFYLKSNDYPPSGSDVSVLYTPVDGSKVSNLDKSTVDEINVHWDIGYTNTGTVDVPGYDLTLTGTGSGYDGLVVTYSYTRGKGGTIKDSDGT
jgi:type II secretion system protein G